MKPQEIIRDPRDSVISLDSGEAVWRGAYGCRASKLARLMALGLPVPAGVVLSFDAVARLAGGEAMPDLGLDRPPGGLLALRCSPEERDWGGVAALLNVGANDASLEALAGRIGAEAALRLHLGYVTTYGHTVHGIDPEDFEMLARDRIRGNPAPDEATLRALLDDMTAFFEEEAGEPWPQDPAVQLEAGARAMARAWNAPTARILRQVRGAPEEAGLGILVQRMVFGVGPGACGSGHIQIVDGRTGRPMLEGAFRPQGQGAGGFLGAPAALPMTAPEGGSSLEAAAPEALAQLREAARQATIGLGDAYRLEFALESGRVAVLDAVPVRRTGRGAVRIAVDLAKAGAITRHEALLRVEPRSLIEHLHPQIDPTAHRDVCGTEIGRAHV